MRGAAGSGRGSYAVWADHAPQGRRMSSLTRLFKCKKCGQVYPIIPYYPYAAPHGPNRDCRSRDWIDITNHPEDAS